MARYINGRSDLLPILTEIFREYGFDGASLSVLSKQTGLGKGSLYHFFPGGKEEMASAVLADIDAWFATHIFAPLYQAPTTQAGVRQMLEAVERYFHSGQRMCLMGVFALGSDKEQFAVQVNRYFTAWVDALADALARSPAHAKMAREAAQDAVGSIQGALILARGLGQPALFTEALRRLERRLLYGP